MIQFNLLPDVKLQYIKAAKTKRLVASVAVLVSAAVIAVVGLLGMLVLGFQKNHISRLNGDIKAYRQELEGSRDINKILTVQNQLNKLNSLHEQKPATSRLFGYLNGLTPDKVTLSSVKLNFEESSAELVGDAPAMLDVNQYVDTLKFTKFDEAVEGAQQLPTGDLRNAFSDVVMAEFRKKDGGAFEYKITMKYDPVIFDNTKNISLVIPDITTTRSEVEKPSQVFLKVPEEQN